MTDLLRVVFSGHVDHGKSTVIGRLLYETKNLPKERLQELEIASRRRGTAMQWGFAIDALQAERDLSFTMDAAWVWLRWNGSRYAFIDTPGHREFVRHMFSGSAEADAAVLVVDVADGICEQTRRHAQIFSLFGIDQIVVAINKMDAAEYDASKFASLELECRALLRSFGVPAPAVIPVSAHDGDNFTTLSDRMPWYTGPSLMAAIAQFEPRARLAGPLRMRVQDVYRFGGERIAVGRIDSGTVAIGDPVIVAPAGTRTTVRSIERWHAPRAERADAGDSVGLTFSDPVFMSRGDVIAERARSIAIDYGFRATCFWLAENPPVVGEVLQAAFGPQKASVSVVGVSAAFDSGSLEALAPEALVQYAVLELRLRSNSLLALDVAAKVPQTAKLILARDQEVAAAGFVNTLFAPQRERGAHAKVHLLTPHARALRNGHEGAVVWLTGLSGAGKSTLAMALERRLFEAGAAVVVLDGDEVRSGLNSDLGFSEADRAENVRRIRETAILLANAGMIVVVACIAPMQRDREMARLAAAGSFHEVYVKASLATCESRDPKGLYERARAGEIADFTGISAPYEPPSAPDYVIDTEIAAVEESTEELATYVFTATGLRELPLLEESPT